MKIEKLDEKSKEKLREYLLRDFSKNAIYLYDLDREYPTRADFSIALEDNKIKGFSVIWADNPDFCYLHIIAEDENVFSNLFNMSENSFDKVRRLIVPSEFSPIVTKRLGINGIPMYLANLKKGEEKLSVKHDVRILYKKDMEDIKKLISEAIETHIHDERIGRGIINSIEKSLDWELLFGCYIDNELASFIRATISYPPIAMIDTLYTRQNFRNRGAAMSTESGIIRELFYNRNIFNEVQLYEEKNNIPAYNLHKKIGFRVLKDYMRFSL